MLATDTDALQAQLVAQHAAAQELNGGCFSQATDS